MCRGSMLRPLVTSWISVIILLRAAGKTDRIEGVSESVIVGKTMGIGTGSVEVVRYLDHPVESVGKTGKDEFPRRSCAFEETWERAGRRQRRK